ERAHERLFEANVRLLERGAVRLDLVTYRVFADIRDGTGADDALRRSRPAEVLVELGELEPLAGALRHPRRLALLHLAAREPRQAASVVRQAVAVAAELAVADDVDPGAGLLLEHVNDRVAQPRLDRLRIRFPPPANSARRLRALRRPLEPPGVGRQYAVRASLHCAFGSRAPSPASAACARAPAADRAASRRRATSAGRRILEPASAARRSSSPRCGRLPAFATLSRPDRPRPCSARITCACPRLRTRP